MPINIIRKKNADPRTPFRNSSPYDNRYGFWAVVTEVHPEDMTVHIRMDTGFELAGVRVASMEWVTVDDSKNYLSGERHLPPVGTYVFCMCPNGEISTAFVLCSGFLIHQAKHSAFKEKGKENSYKTVENSGWVKETDYKTGNKTIKNKPENETISIDVKNADAQIKIKIGNNVFTVGNGSISIDGSDKVEVKSKSDITVSSTGNVTIESSTVGQLKIGNSVGTLGSFISDLIQDVSTAVLVTPAGPGTLDPSTIAKLTALLAQWKAVFS